MRIGWMFSGQGSERVGMGLDFIERYPHLKHLTKTAQDILGYDPIEALQDSKTFLDTSKIQPLTFLFQVIVLELLKEKHYKSSCSFGLSLGEYAALYDGGVFSFETGLALLKKRGELMQRVAHKNPGKMVAILGLKASDLHGVIDGIDGVVIANYNAPKQLVISGDIQAVDDAVLKCKAAGAKKAIPLSTIGAFHSPLMEEAASGYQEILLKSDLRDPKKPVFMNVTGKQLDGSIPKLLSKHLTSPVLFYQMVESLDKIDVLVEVGPKKVLCNLVKRIDRRIKTIHIGTMETFESGIKELENDIYK